MKLCFELWRLPVVVNVGCASGFGPPNGTSKALRDPGSTFEGPAASFVPVRARTADILLSWCSGPLDLDLWVPCLLTLETLYWHLTP
jgi:hypothetical protein